MTPAINAVDLSVQAGQRRILHVPRWQVAPGEAAGVLGPNGAGKSTLLRVCLGFQRPTTGDVRVLGERVGALRMFGLARLRARIGYVPQTLAAHQQMPLTLREVVAIGRAGRRGLFRSLTRDDRDRVDAWIERLGLTERRKQAYTSLSGGEQRKTLIARAMVQDPELLILDEPTANLDLRWRERIVATLDELFADGATTMVLVCHELEVLPRCCRRVLLLCDGEVVDDDAPERTLTDDRIAAVWGPGLTVRHAGGRHALLPVEAEVR